MSDQERGEEEEREPRRPRVVDKRISSRERTEPSPSEPAPATAVTPEPPVEASPPPPAAPPQTTEPPAGEPPVWTPQQEEEARRIAEEIVRTPSLEWVVNTAVTLANVSATKLEFGSPTDAQLTIDALAGVLNAVGNRLEDAEAPLKQTLAQLQLAYTQRISAPPPPQS